MSALWLIILCGCLAIVYGVWAIGSVMKADAGNAKMQEISAAVREGAQAYLKRQYTTIAWVGAAVFIAAAFVGQRPPTWMKNLGLGDQWLKAAASDALELFE